MDKYSFYQQLLEEEKNLIETLKALQLLIKRYEIENPGNFVKSHEPQNYTSTFDTEFKPASPTIKFKPGMTVAAKVMHVLSVLGSATSKEVGLKIHEIEPNYSEKKAISDARFYLSKLYNENVITVDDSNSARRGHSYTTKK